MSSAERPSYGYAKSLEVIYI